MESLGYMESDAVMIAPPTISQQEEHPAQESAEKPLQLLLPTPQEITKAQPQEPREPTFWDTTILTEKVEIVMERLLTKTENNPSVTKHMQQG